jgi:hypothetical protein
MRGAKLRRFYMGGKRPSINKNNHRIDQAYEKQDFVFLAAYSTRLIIDMKLVTWYLNIYIHCDSKNNCSS